jgi:hypothetical protein
MFILRDWLFGGKNSYSYNDDDNDDPLRERQYRSRHKERKTQYDAEYNDEGDEEGEVGHEEYDEWRNGYERDETDDAFFHDLEVAHQFNQGELSTFYYAVREAYLYELPSTNSHAVENMSRDINTFVRNFLSYLTIGYQNQSTMRCYPRLIYTNHLELTQSLAPSQIDRDTFKVDRRLDFVYAYVIEKGIIDTLKFKGEQIIQYQSEEYRFIEDLLLELDSFKEIYRTRVNSQYVSQDRQSMLTADKISDSWIIYTKRSSNFFTQCMATIKERQGESLIYTYETLRIEPIPFQQVLLLCGAYPNFLEDHTVNIQKEGPINTNITDADDWVSVPIWFSLLYTTPLLK